MRSLGGFAALPVLATSFLLLGAGVDRVTSPAPGDSRAYMTAVRQAYERLPHRLGNWVGTDVALPASAITLLRPNFILSRNYVDLQTGRKATVLLVHCSDARDIIGHFPPNCYPSAGWVMQSSERKLWSINGTQVPGFEYRFSAEPASGIASLVVMNTMLLPDGNFREDMVAVRKTAAQLRRRSWGAGQIQIIVDETLPPAERDEVFISLMQAHWPLIEAILNSAPPAVAQK